MMRPQHACELGETLLLRVGEAHIKRRAGVGDPLESGARLAHVVGPTRQPLERRGRRLVLRLLLPRFTRLHSRDAKLSHFAQRLFECRPVFRLVGRKFETGLERGDTGVGIRRHIFGARTMSMLEARTAISTRSVVTLLGIH